MWQVMQQAKVIVRGVVASWREEEQRPKAVHHLKCMNPTDKDVPLAVSGRATRAMVDDDSQRNPHPIR